VIANMRGRSAEEVAGKILASELLRGLQVGRSSTVTSSHREPDPNTQTLSSDPQDAVCHATEGGLLDETCSLKGDLLT
jgi:hypothetical protein